jgi:hypothetical protein
MRSNSGHGQLDFFGSRLRGDGLKFFLSVLVFVGFTYCSVHAQGNYEIQVYGSETVPRRTTMFEIHSNFTADGQTETIDGVIPTNHAQHETLEITQGITDWSEVGFYLFSSIQSQTGWDWVGDHIRPRVRVPPQWHWPVGVSLSQEIGYQRAYYDPDTWTWEIRPIVDKEKGRLYWSINPTFERTLHGPGIHDGFQFAPNVKVSWDFTKVIAGGVEYYANYGPLSDVYRLHDQQQQIFPAIDLNVSPLWEINFGVGIGATASTDHMILKCILGRRFNWRKTK